MNALWQGLVANLALAGAFVSSWTFLGNVVERFPPFGQRVAFGLVMGLGVFTVMSFPFQSQPGFNSDVRLALIVIAGYFGGPVSGLLAGAIGAGYRLALGGPGAPGGAISIGVATAIGLAGFALQHGRVVTRINVLTLALAGAASGPLLLLVLPANAPLPVFDITLTTSVLVFVTTVLTGLALRQDLERRTVDSLNRTYRGVIEALPESLNVKTPDGRFLIANAATAGLMRAADARALLGRSDFDFFPPDIAESFHQDEALVIRNGVAAEIEQHLVHADGSDAWLSTLKAPLRDVNGELLGIITHNRDITSRKALEQEVREVRDRLSGAMAGMADALVAFGADGTLLYCNTQYRQMFPRTAYMRVPGASFRDILRATIDLREQIGIPQDNVERWIEDSVKSLRVESETEIELSDGRWLHTRVRPLADGSSLSVLSDITRIKLAESALSELNRQLKLLASTDALTGLSNRRAFDDALEREFSRGRRHGRALSLLMLDVDLFKRFNDSYGHTSGDHCLQAVAAAIRNTSRRPGDVVARYGGEEFALVLPDTSPEGALELAEHIRASVEKLGIPHGGSATGTVTVSIGIATLTPDQPLPLADDLINRADTALYEAKQLGRNRVAAATPPAPLLKFRSN